MSRKNFFVVPRCWPKPLSRVDLTNRSNLEKVTKMVVATTMMRTTMMSVRMMMAVTMTTKMMRRTRRDRPRME